ncbi:larval cuticle protein LCP-22-like [Plodia interpunctella]|uniref:larval cuticle protein LCP-22-like n=1 Tax=Plodia interpunctella TaxID=58824 RepID=UPI002368E0F2|nr:larval cuticle protein LCP-22-like [Plodia interpunctella]
MYQSIDRSSLMKMKSAVAFLALLAVAHAQFLNQGRRPAFPSPPQPQPTRPLAPSPNRYAGNDANANIVRYEDNVEPNGAFSYALETDNGIAAQAQGTPRDFGGNPPVAPVVIQGSYSYLTPEGEQVAISYVADENGYQPSGAALPTPPPVPPQIQRALEFIARNPPRQ